MLFVVVDFVFEEASPPLLAMQLRTARTTIAEALGHHATAAKLLQEEVNEKGHSKSLDERLIQVCLIVILNGCHPRIIAALNKLMLHLTKVEVKY